jgi:hypothetical protein
VVTLQVIGGIVSLSIVNSCRARCVWVSGGIDDFCWRRHLGYDGDGVGGGGGGMVMKVAAAVRPGNGKR